jgi:hypothetical protein
MASLMLQHSLAAMKRLSLDHGRPPEPCGNIPVDSI